MFEQKDIIGTDVLDHLGLIAATISKLGLVEKIDEKMPMYVAIAECRSIPNQIEYWARIGKCALDNPDLPIEFIKELMISKKLTALWLHIG